MDSNSGSNDPFGAIKFGEFRKYMQNKKSKLKRQEKEVEDQCSQNLIKIFKGTSIHINGYTNPPSSELRRLILLHGGDYQHYLKKLSVTHIIATNLTNSKIKEFRSYKIVKPEWITESIKAQKLLPWQNYRLISTSSNQKELALSEFIMQPNDLNIQNELSKKSSEYLNAQVLSRDWAREITSVNPNFIKQYYENSRLHHLSTWKSELKEIVKEIEEKYQKNTDLLNQNGNESYTRIVMHIDFDCFFAAAGIRDRPHLKNEPVAVAHTTVIDESSSSDIASCNYVARSYGIKNGMTIGRAKSLCPRLQVIPYEFNKYRQISQSFYEIVFKYADKIEAVSIDEALIEVGTHIKKLGSGEEELAAKIREEVKKTTGCEVSIGIGPNILLARMATKKAKPSGQYYYRTQDDIDEFLSSQNVIDLPGVGHSTKEKLLELKVTTVRDLREVHLLKLQEKLGFKVGKNLYEFSRGIDNRPLSTNQQRQSVSAEVNWGIRFESELNEKEFLYNLSKEVCERLHKNKVKGKLITLKVLKRKENAEEAAKCLGHGKVDPFSKSISLADYTDNEDLISKHAYSLLKSFQFSYADIRGLGIHITKLNNMDRGSFNQAKLTFGTKNTENQNAILKSDNQSPKKDLTVDYSVYQELPESVQKEILSNFNLIFCKPNHAGSQENLVVYGQEEKLQVNNSVKGSQLNKNDRDEDIQHMNNSQSFGSQLLTELPPWSQLDPSALLALPDSMRKQVLKAYENKKKLADDSIENYNTLHSTHKVKSTAKNFVQSNIGMATTNTETSHKFSNKPPVGNTLKTSTGLESGSKTVFNEQIKPTICDHEEDLSFDADVWKELPYNVRLELLNERRKKKESESLKRIQKEHLENRASKTTIKLQYIDEPNLQGIQDLDEIRSLLKTWVVSCEESLPESDDVLTVCSYFAELIRFGQLDKAKILLVYLQFTLKDFCKKGIWDDILCQIQSHVSNTIRECYGSELKFI